MSRVEWSADGTLLLVHAFRGVPRVRTLTGELVASYDPGTQVLDARWAGHAVVTLDAHCKLTTFSGNTRGEIRLHESNPPVWASLASAGSRIAVGAIDASVYDADIDHYTPAWRYSPLADLHLYDRHLHHDALRRSFRGVLSDDGLRVALGFDSTTWDSDEAGFRWRVFELASGMEIATEYVPGATALSLAFDATGHRLAIAGPPPHGPIGVFDVEPRCAPLLAYPEMLTGAGAVALEQHGALAAFAIGHTIRFDDLEGGATLSLPVDLFDVVALAFSPDSRQLACLASNGKVAVVPVP